MSSVGRPYEVDSRASTAYNDFAESAPGMVSVSLNEEIMPESEERSFFSHSL